MVKHWVKLPGKVMEFPSLKMFKAQFDKALSNLL